MLSVDVEKGEPREAGFERGINDRQTDGLPFVERAEEYTSVRNHRRGELDLSIHAVLARTRPGPVRNLRHRHWSLCQPTVDHAVLDVDVLGPIDRGEERNVGGLKFA